MTIAFVGGGNMATALIGGMLANGRDRNGIRVAEIDPGAAERLRAMHGVSVYPRLSDAVTGAATVVLAVKPQQLASVAREIAGAIRGALVISIAAGVRTVDLSRWLGGHADIVRVMPNTPALVRAGVSALYAMPAVSGARREQAREVLAAVGSTVWLEREDDLDAVTAISGSGPAYVFYFMEAMLKAAEDLGIAAAVARTLVLETFAGAARLALDSPESAAELRRRVTSKGGTTEAAIARLEQAAVAEHIAAAVEFAARRSRELGDLLARSED